MRRLARGATDGAIFEPAWSGPPYGYRARARLLVDEGRLGYRARRSHERVEIERCPILVPALEASLPRLAAALPSDARGELAVAAAGERVAAWGEGFAGLSPEAIAMVPPGRGLEVNDAVGRAFVGPATFAQANPSGNDAMLETVGRWIPSSALALELYSGSGNFTRVLEQAADRVIAAEVDGGAVRLADRVRGAATSLWRLGALRALERAERAGLAPDLALVDPPRSGLDRVVADRLARLAPPTVVYVSCDPGTFARDVARLFARGYRVNRLRFFDLYPQTPHVEVIGRLVRAPTLVDSAEATP
jgi:23S rRNA (uracil1939-C5)-methyltransferase